MKPPGSSSGLNALTPFTVAVFVAVSAVSCESRGKSRDTLNNSDRQPVPYAAELMPPALNGVALGIDWPTLKRARPRVAHGRDRLEHGGTFDYVSELDPGMVMYYFSDKARPDTAVSQPLPSGFLTAVEIMPAGILWSDTAGYRRAITSFTARWDSAVGPADSVIQCWYTDQQNPEEYGPKVWRTWRRPDVVLLLESTPDNYRSPKGAWRRDPSKPEPGERRSLTAIIQSSRLPVGIGFFSSQRAAHRCTTVNGASHS